MEPYFGLTVDRFSRRIILPVDSGRDTVKESGDRALVDQTVSPQGVFRLAIALYTISILIVASILTDSHLALAAVFFSGVALSFFYTAGPVSLKCVALGDVVIFLCFGPLLVYFTALLLLQGHQEKVSLGWAVWAYTIPFGLLTECILHANNARDMDMDQRSGIVTLPIIIGYDSSRVLFIAMIATSYLASLTLAVWQYWGNGLVLVTLPIAVDLIKRFQPKVSNTYKDCSPVLVDARFIGWVCSDMVVTVWGWFLVVADHGLAP